MRTLKLSFLITCLIISITALATLHFPTLTGRVVDNAHILSPNVITSLEQTLANYEQQTSNQVVVVTLASLQGTSIEDYGYQLGRTWQIGQKGKDNGVLFIIAPNERKVRIEVGYGLESLLTDANASTIINTTILPQFRAGNMTQGILDGTKAILAVLSGQNISSPQIASQATTTDSTTADDILTSIAGSLCLLWFLGHYLVWISSKLLGLFGLSSKFSRFCSSRLHIPASFLSCGSQLFRGDSFSIGGGGSFGGGGASGSW